MKTNNNQVQEPPQSQVKGVTQAQFTAWRHHPVTRMFMQYLRDWRDDMKEDAVERWTAGALDSKSDHELRGWFKALTEISDMRLDPIAKFYEDVDAMKNANARGHDDDEAATD